MHLASGLYLNIKAMSLVARDGNGYFQRARSIAKEYDKAISIRWSTDVGLCTLLLDNSVALRYVLSPILYMVMHNRRRAHTRRSTWVRYHPQHGRYAFCNSKWSPANSAGSRAVF